MIFGDITTVLNDILDFILRYWTYLAMVAGLLCLILIAALIVNAKNKFSPEETDSEPSVDPIIAPEPETVKEVETGSTVASSDSNPLESAPIAEPVPSSEVLPVGENTPTSGSAEQKELQPAEALVNAAPTPVSPENGGEPATENPDPVQKPAPKPKKNLGKYHVMYRADGKWIVKREGSPAILRVLETQREAISWATIKALPQDIGMVVHKKDGKIRKNTPL